MQMLPDTNGDRVLMILRKIEGLDIMLHEEHSPLLTVTELTLYMLIHRHVDLYIQLFQSEDLMTVIKSCSRKIGGESTHAGTSFH
jgi:hypothetical protein